MRRRKVFDGKFQNKSMMLRKFEESKVLKNPQWVVPVHEVVKMVNWLGTLACTVLKAAVPGTQRDLVRIRLQRFGRKNLPFYRIVAADVRSPRDGKCLEYLGTYNPIANKEGEKHVTVDIERVKYWLVVGAQPSDRVAKLLGSANILPAKPLHRFTVPEAKESEKQAS